MNMWEQGSRSDPQTDYTGLGPNRDQQSHKLPGAPTGGWRLLAAVAAGALFGAPLMAGGTAHAAWVQISQFLASWRSWYGSTGN